MNQTSLGAARAELIQDSWLPPGPGWCGGPLGASWGQGKEEAGSITLGLISFSINMTSFDMAWTQSARGNLNL